MSGKKLPVFILLIVAMELFCTVDAWPTCDSSIPHYSGIGWHNKWHEPFYAICPYGYSLSQWISLFRQCKEDRIYHMRCSLAPAFDSSNCAWTSILNNLKQSFIYMCPNNGFINGIYSSFDTTSKDRSLKVRCCNVNGYQRFNCKMTPYMNQYGGLLNYFVGHVDQGYTLVGVGSKHSVEEPSISYSDRRWMFYICQVKQMQCTETNTSGR